MILFRPVGRPPEVFSFNGTLMSQPLTSNPDALNSPKVYFIFVGPQWKQNGAPIAAVNSMIAAVKAILSSAYLSGLKQYGSDGNAVFGDFTIDTSLDPLTWTKDYTLPNGTIDHSNNPVWYETDKILSNPAFSSWNPPPGNALTSPIYVVPRYAGGPAGSNDFGPNPPYTSRAVNIIDVTISSVDDIDGFSWAFSHELAERISSGIGGLQEVSPDPGGQIADGEPEGNDYYAWQLNGSSGPVVTSYWSFLDQAFVIPDGNLQRVLVVPVWSGASWTRKCVSLQQGNLYLVSPSRTKTLIDSEVQSYATTSVGGVFDLTPSGQVKEYSGSGTNWTAVTGANTVASALVATADGGLYMIAANQGETSRVWRYTGSGTNWTAVTGANTTVWNIAVAGGRLYMMASNNGGPIQVWQYSGSGTNWTAVTGTNTSVSAIVAAGGQLYMLASNERSTGGPYQVWQYSGSGTNWTAVTGTNTATVAIVAAGDVLCMLAANQPGPNQVWQYGLSPNIWIPLTGTNTSVGQIVVQDGIEQYMLASNDGVHNQVWQYNSAPGSWTAITGLNTTVNLIRVTADNRLHMTAANDGANFRDWIYDGTPYSWTAA